MEYDEIACVLDCIFFYACVIVHLWVYIVLVVCVFISDLSLFLSISYTWRLFSKYMPSVLFLIPCLSYIVEEMRERLHRFAIGTREWWIRPWSWFVPWNALTRVLFLCVCVCVSFVYVSLMFPFCIYADVKVDLTHFHLIICCWEWFIMLIRIHFYSNPKYEIIFICLK
jgi:hypothetical protein